MPRKESILTPHFPPHRRNGALAAFSGSLVLIEVTGDAAVVPFANVRITFGGGAAGHFGADPVDGVVTIRAAKLD